ncbi:MAG: hypothetical protein NDI61_12115 [Bdellovibrionaceae bacterium]|nr:hypothetical protein [Pseudobdellovibrionaceae bacterium]
MRQPVSAWKVFAVFITFILASASLLASAPDPSTVPSFGAVKVGGQSVLITYGPDERENADTRFNQKLAPAGLEKEARRFREVIVGVGEIARGSKMPERVHLNVAAITEDPSANSFEGILNVGRTYGRVDRLGRLYTQNPTTMIPIIAHEFGHMVFHANILADLPETKVIEDAFRDEDKMIKQMDQLEERRKNLERWDNPRAEAELNRIYSEIERLSIELERLEQKVRVAASALNVADPYHEFYADVIAILYTGQPNSVADAIHMAQTKAGRSHGERKRSSSEIRNRQFERRGSGHPRVESGHAVFFEARQTLWNEYLQRPLVLRDRKQDVLRAVTRAVHSEVRWLMSISSSRRSAETAETWPMEKVRVLNRRLISQLRSELGDL